jgi:hypothetical protein
MKTMRYRNIRNSIIFLLLLNINSFAERITSGDVELVRLKYSGGGDWYNGPSELPNISSYVRENTGISIFTVGKSVEILSENLFNYPFLFMTGHGNVTFSNEEIIRLRHYLQNGGFMFVNDDYSLDTAFRREIAKVFPQSELVELPFSHEIYHSFYNFPNGLPKIHEHDKKSPKGLGLYHEGRLVLFYAYESDIADGWDDPQVHGDSEEKRTKALKMGTNIIVYALTN